MKRIAAHEIPSNAVIVDIRDALELHTHPLKDSRTVWTVGLQRIENETLDLPEVPLVVVCTSGALAALAAAHLQAMGANDVMVLEGGALALLKATT